MFRRLGGLTSTLSQLTKDVFIEDADTADDGQKQTSRNDANSKNSASVAGSSGGAAASSSSGLRGSFNGLLNWKDGTSANMVPIETSGKDIALNSSDALGFIRVSIVASDDQQTKKLKEQIRDLEEAVQAMEEELVAAQSSSQHHLSTATTHAKSLEADAELAKAQLEIANLNTRLQKEQEKVSRLSSSVQKTTNSNSSAIPSNSVSKKQYDDLLAFAIKAAKLVVEKRSSLVESGAYDACFALMQESMARILSKISENESMRIQLEELSEDAHRARSFEAEVSELHTELSAREVTIQRLTAQMSESRTSLSEKIVDLESRVRELQSANNKLESTVKDLQDRSAREEMTRVRSMDTLEAELHVEREKMRKEFDEWSSQKDAYETSIADRDDQIRTLKEQLSVSLRSQGNLEAALQSFEQELAFEKEHTSIPLRSKVRDLEQRLEKCQLTEEKFADVSERLSALQKEMDAKDKFAIALRDENLRLKEEISALRDHLEESLVRLKNAMDDEFVVDRRIVNDLLVAYVSRKGDRQVLELMAKILHLSDDDKEKMGLIQQSSRSLWVSVFQKASNAFNAAAVKSPDAAQKTRAVTNDAGSLSDLFVQFLIKEATKSELGTHGTAATPLSPADDTRLPGKEPHTP
ncbi:mitochondrial Smc domain-containing protein [Andalucia godoyi]|uniref:Mitochondrial Smc domain-containing protein n=1 Tax=Andalucia godoyi TaxID=505711 RepID=A0A8K0F1W1_ANDGO|nr:mitochondrial Smc domain-containing protein [Andalucia godoyi]|eukprot:ANDGO_03000.mRNA.1 mitochondrial Smc domain-containing protein